MRNPRERYVYLLAMGCVALFVAAVVLPRLMRDHGGGFAASTAAALVFAGLALSGALLSLFLLGSAWRDRVQLSAPARFVAVAPIALLVLGLGLLWMFFL